MTTEDTTDSSGAQQPPPAKDTRVSGYGISRHGARWVPRNEWRVEVPETDQDFDPYSDRRSRQ